MNSSLINDPDQCYKSFKLCTISNLLRFRSSKQPYRAKSFLVFWISLFNLKGPAGDAGVRVKIVTLFKTSKNAESESELQVACLTAHLINSHRVNSL